VNYTMYNIRCAQDVINVNSDHRDIMLLSSSSEPSHPFCYARVLGIFHVNVMYTGPGLKDYLPRHLEFLWVRWLKPVKQNAPCAHNLEALQFMKLSDEDAFGFVDPADILCSCHLIPAFAGGKVHADSTSVSRNARDGMDWKRYYVNQ
ncbi:hypothetical protein HYDPIDRAFT_99913, partial [Hydnomerulius pinastri MD-312]